MSNYAIMRCKKLKSLGSVASSLQHCFRQRETLNADSELTDQNKHFVNDNTDSAMGALRERLPAKRRKDAVVCVEYMMTTSPEWAKNASDDEIEEFMRASVSFLETKYGKDNVLVASAHFDESTPHLSAFVTPITDDGRLSAKDFIGNKRKMSDDQTAFAKSVEHLGLERGIKGSLAKHKSIQQYYNEIQTQDVDLIEFINNSDWKMQDPEFMENKKDYAKRLIKSLLETIEKFSKEIQSKSLNYKNFKEKETALIQQYKSLERKNESLANENKNLEAAKLKHKSLLSVIQDLPEDVRKNLIKQYHDEWIKQLDQQHNERTKKTPVKTSKNKGLKL